MKRHRITIAGDRVQKRYAPADLWKEHAKAMALWACSVDSGFRAPRVLDVHEATSTITYEFIPDMISLRETYLELMRGSESPRAARLIGAAGAALAAIHRSLSLAETCRWRPSESFTRGTRRSGIDDVAALVAARPQAVLHGDYGFSNLYFQSRSPDATVIVIDPSPNRFVTFDVNARTSIDLDLAHFTSCLDGLVPLRRCLGVRWHRLRHIKELFWSSYEEESGQSVSRDCIGRLAYATAYAYFSRRLGEGVRHRLAMGLLYNSMKKNVP